MIYLKIFENFDLSRLDIDALCNRYGITNYTINGNGSIDVDGDIKNEVGS